MDDGIQGKRRRGPNLNELTEVQRQQLQRVIEEALKGAQNYGGTTLRTHDAGFRYQRRDGIVARVGRHSGPNTPQFTNGGDRNSKDNSRVSVTASMARPSENAVLGQRRRGT